MVVDSLSIDIGNLGDIKKSFSIPTLEGHELSLSHETLMQELNGTLHAIVTDHAIATAFAEGKSIAEKVSLARDTVMTYFKDGFTDTSGSLMQAINMMKSSSSLADYVRQKLSFSGMSNAASSGDLIINSMEYEYTGASPTSAYCFDTVKKFRDTTLSIAATAAVVILNGIVFVGRKLFKKATKAVKEIAIDPYDLRKINGEEGNHTISGFACQTSPAVSFLKPDRFDLLISKLEKAPIHCDFLSAEAMLYLDEDKYIKFPRTIFDQVKVLARLQGVSEAQILNASTLVDLYRLVTGRNHYEIITDLKLHIMAYDVPFEDLADNLAGLNQQLYYLLLWSRGVVQGQLKIKPLSYRVYANSLPVYDSSNNSYSISEMVNFVNHLTSAPCVYADVDDNEIELYNSFVLGMHATAIIFAVMRLEADGTLEEYSDGEVDALDVGIPDFNYKTGSGVKITNADFLNVAVAGGFDDELEIFTVDVAMKIAMANLQLALCNVFAYREEHPLDYSFWPYSQNMTSWFLSSFEIVPDKDNIDRFNVAVTAFVAIAAVVTVALVTGIRLKRAYTNSIITKQAALMRAAQAANNGVLDKGAIKAFRRASRWNALLARLTGNLAIADFRPESNECNTVDFSPLFAIISGETVN
jgi:hypothetical protein